LQFLEIENNPNLTSLVALNNIRGSLLRLSIRDCNSLTNLGSFDEILKFSTLSIINNPQLTNVDCFPNITNALSIQIYNCTSVNSISFPSLTRLGYLNIEENSNLTNLNFLSLTEFSGGSNGDFSMIIDKNDSLTMLNGFDNLTNNLGLISINISYQTFENPSDKYL